MNTEYKNRKEHRIKWYDYSSAGAYFITVCTKERKNYFWTEVGATIGRPYDFKLSSYGLMVEHTINQVINQMKGHISKQIGQSIWQKSFYEHIVRNEKEYFKIKEYIKYNVINWRKDKYF